MHTDTAYRSALGLTLAATLALVGVGVLGNELDPDRVSLAVLPLILVGAVIAYVKTRKHNTAYRWGVRVALGAAFILFWMIGAVGVMGSDDNHPGDLMYIGVLAVGVIGAIIGRFQPHEMARALFATALAQVSVAVIAVVAGMQSPAAPVAEILVLNGFFAALFAGSGLLFRKAARDQAPVNAQPAD